MKRNCRIDCSEAEKRSAARGRAAASLRATWRLTMIVLLAATGCHAPKQHGTKPSDCVCTPRGPCGGYFSTCWRQWPSECQSCPPMLEAVEPMANPSLPSEVIPPPAAPAAMPYAPMPPGEGAPPVDGELDPNTPTSRCDEDLGKGDSRGPANPAPPPRHPISLTLPLPEEQVVFRHTTLQLREPPSQSTTAQIEPSSKPDTK